jgi:hypothetical protein
MCDYRVLLVNDKEECFVIDKGLKFFSKEEPKDKNSFVWYSPTTKVFNLTIRVRMNADCQNWLSINNTELSVYVYNKESKKWLGYAETTLKRRGLSKTTEWTIEDVMLKYKSEVSMTSDLIESLDSFTKQVLRDSTLNELL